MSGRSPLRGSGLRPFGTEPQASQPEALVPNADIFTALDDIRGDVEGRVMDQRKREHLRLLVAEVDACHAERSVMPSKYIADLREALSKQTARADRAERQMRDMAAENARRAKVASEPGPLVEFFREDGFFPYGHKGDYEGWSPEQTAVHFLREHLGCAAKAIEARSAETRSKARPEGRKRGAKHSPNPSSPPIENIP